MLPSPDVGSLPLLLMIKKLVCACVCVCACQRQFSLRGVGQSFNPRGRGWLLLALFIRSSLLSAVENSHLLRIVPCRTRVAGCATSPRVRDRTRHGVPHSRCRCCLQSWGGLCCCAGRCHAGWTGCGERETMQIKAADSAGCDIPFLCPLCAPLPFSFACLIFIIMCSEQ